MTAMRAQQRHIRGGWSWGHPVGLVAKASVRPAVLPIAGTTVWVKHGTRIAGVPAGYGRRHRRRLEPSPTHAPAREIAWAFSAGSVLLTCATLLASKTLAFG